MGHNVGLGRCLVPFLRLTRDQRGYENTFLLHVSQLGERPRILYWYRSAPGVRVGRPALDEDAIRTIEEQHPEIEFDWPHIFAIGAAMTPEVERRPERGAQRGSRAGETDRGASTREIVGSLTTGLQRGSRPRDGARPRDSRAEELERAQRKPAGLQEPDSAAPLIAEPAPTEGLVPAAEANQSVSEIPEPLPQTPAERHDLLEELVGREIATRLRARYTEIHTRLEAIPDAARRDEWRARVEALDPDTWATPEEILHGVQRADSLFEEFRRALKLD